MDWFIGLNPILQGLIATLFTYFVTALGASFVFFFKSMNKKVLDMMMSFAAGVMIAASFFSLLAPALELATELNINSYLTVSLGFLSGGLFIIGSDIVLGRIERLNKKGAGFKRSLMLTLAVTLHNIPEGMAVGVAFGSVVMGLENATIIGAIMLALGIGLQNFPEGVCVAMPLRREGASRFKSFFVGQASAIVEPIAGVLGVVFALHLRNALPLALSFSAGAMIAVVCSELILEAFKDNKTLASLGLLVGFSVMMILDVALG